MREEKPSNKEPDRIRCAECGTRLSESDKECPNCGSTERTSGSINFNVETRAGLGVKTTVSGVHEAHMSPQSWTILGLISALVIPPLFYAVFSILTFHFGFKLLIWLGIVLIAFFLAKSYRVIMFLRFLADKAYGKRKI